MELEKSAGNNGSIISTKVRLTGRAQTAFQRLLAENQTDFTRATTALKERFEPASKKHRYQAEMQTRKGESWADLADDLKSLADKAYPELEEAARDRLALNNFLSQLDHPQVAFGVRQKNPENLDAAVSATLELESYVNLKPSTFPVMGVEEVQQEEEEAIGAVHTTDKLSTVLDGVMLRLEKLETSSKQQRSSPRSYDRDRNERHHLI